MSYYHAEIINMSLKSNKILKEFQMIDIKKRFLDFVKIITIAIPEGKIEKTVVLDVSRVEDKDKWEELIQYAKSLGVPDSQCDFLPENFAKETY